METLFVSTGLACIVAAIVGGGLKAANMEIPLLKSVGRQVLLGVMGFVFLSLGMADRATPAAPAPDTLAVRPPDPAGREATGREGVGPRPPAPVVPAVNQGAMAGGAPARPTSLRPLAEVVAEAAAGEYAGPGPDATISDVRLSLEADGADLSGSVTFQSAAMPLRVTERVTGTASADGTLRLRGTEVRAEGPDGFVGAPQGAHRYELRRDGGAIGGVLRNAAGEVYPVRLARQD